MPGTSIRKEVEIHSPKSRVKARVGLLIPLSSPLPTSPL